MKPGTNKTAGTHSRSLLAFATDQLAEIHAWELRFLPLVKSPKGRMAAFARIAAETGVSMKRVTAKFYSYQERGIASLLDRRKVTKLPGGASGISPSDQKLIERYVGRSQGRRKPALKRLLNEWRAGRVKTRTPVNAATGFPRGWSVRNLLRHAPDRRETEAVRLVKLEPGTRPITILSGALEFQIGAGTIGGSALRVRAVARKKRSATKGSR